MSALLAGIGLILGINLVAGAALFAFQHFLERHYDRQQRLEWCKRRHPAGRMTLPLSHVRVLP